MDEKNFDIMAKIHFFTTAEGGRKTPVFGRHYGCPMDIRGQKFTCRIYLEGIDKIYPGDEVVVPIKFLSPEIVLPLLKKGGWFTLWEAKTVAEGEVIDL